MVKELFILDEKKQIDTVDQLWEVLDSALVEKRKGNTQIVGAITPFTKSGELKRSLIKFGFTIQKEWGKLFQVTREREVPFYALLDRHFVYFITLARKTEDIPGTILNYLKSADDVVLLRMGSRRMRSIRYDLAERFPGIRLSYFTAHREPHTSIASDYRQEVQRTIIYSGNDGFDTLEEMEHQYGIISRIMEFHHDGTVYGKLGIRFDVNGIFTITDGPSLIVRYILDYMVSEHRKTMIIDRLPDLSKKIEIQKGSEVDRDIDAIVGTLGKAWTGSDIEKIGDTLAAEWDITGFLTVTNLRKGYHYSRLVDVVDRSVWDLTLQDTRFTISPVREAGLRSLMKITDVVDDHLGLAIEVEDELKEGAE